MFRRDVKTSIGICIRAIFAVVGRERKGYWWGWLSAMGIVAANNGSELVL
jgi:hypothetical protein